VDARTDAVFFVSPVKMFSFGRKAAPPPVVNGLSQNQANAALVKALHNVANVKLRNTIRLLLLIKF
jgi:hypothetical protein